MAKSKKSLVERIRSSKSIFNIRRIVAAAAKRRGGNPGRGVERVARERINVLSENAA
jgi:hypothetical protein